MAREPQAQDEDPTIYQFRVDVGSASVIAATVGRIYVGNQGEYVRVLFGPQGVFLAIPRSLEGSDLVAWVDGTQIVPLQGGEFRTALSVSPVDGTGPPPTE